VASCGLSMKELTVLSEDKDPYRRDTPAGHRDGAWFGEQVRRFLPSGTVHLRGLHYRIVASGDVTRPNGKPYLNTEEDWTYLIEDAAKCGRWLGYVDFERIVDERNAEAQLFVPESQNASAELSAGTWIDLPPVLALPEFWCLIPVRQPRKQ